MHRWTNGADFAALVWILRQMIEQSGSIEGSSSKACADDAVDVGAALESFSTRALALDLKAIYGRKRRSQGSRIFFPGRHPAARASGSTCSCAGWSAQDRVDLGVWTGCGRGN